MTEPKKREDRSATTRPRKGPLVVACSDTERAASRDPRPVGGVRATARPRSERLRGRRGGADSARAPSHDPLRVRLAGLGQQRTIPIRELHGLQFLPIAECGIFYPTREEFFVCAPAVVDTKARYGIEHFDSKWQGVANMYCGKHDLPLWAGIEPENALIKII